MDWLDATLIGPVWQQVSTSAAAQPMAPTNPSSLTLAMIGICTLALFGFRNRNRSRQHTAGGQIPPGRTRSDDRRAA